MTNDELKEIEDRAKASTEGLTEEVLSGENSRGEIGGGEGRLCWGWDDGSVNWEDDADPKFFVHARADVLRLVAEVRSLRETVLEMRGDIGRTG